MLNNESLNQGSTLVVGLGKTGLSCVRYLVRCGERVSVVDSRAQPPGLLELQREFPQVEVVTGGFSAVVFERARQIVLSPGVARSEPLVRDALNRGVPIINDIELFARQAKAPVIAITGSNGKSTVTTMVGDLAAACGKDVRVGGNIGTPALDLLGETEPDAYVLELSSFQLESVQTLHAAAATVLNISPDHMDRYDDLTSYIHTKAHIFNGGSTMVLNRDDPVVAGFLRPGRTTFWFGQQPPRSEREFGLVETAGETYLACGAERLLAVAELQVAGQHNQANALAALALGRALGWPLAGMVDGLRSYQGLPHRSQLVVKRAGVTWVNDSKGTNVGAAIAAIEGMSGQVVWIGGGDGKGADFRPLRDVLMRKARAAILIGADAGKIEQALAGIPVPLMRISTMEKAVQHAAMVAQPGDSVLLSPACASFDMFNDYEHRGRVFAKAVLELQS